MKEPAVVNYSSEPLSVELRTVDIPDVTAEEALLEVAAVSVCGSDVHQWQGTHGWPVEYPVILGHEFAGTVAKVGARVQGFRVGDRVVSETAAIVDPLSPLTRQGLYNLDPTRKGFGYGVDGAMTRFVRTPARCLHRLPQTVSFLHAASAEPCSVAYNAVVNRASVRPGDHVLVLGPGPIGLLCGLMAQLQGATVTIAGLPQDQERLTVAQQFCMATYDTAPESLGGPLGVSGVIDATGVSRALFTAMQLVMPGGWITKVGWGPEPFGYSIDSLVQKSITLRGTFSHNYAVWESVLALMAAGRLNLGPLISGVWPLEEWQAAFDAMHQGKIVKAVLKPCS